MNKSTGLISFFLVITLFFSCKKDGGLISSVPSIELISTNPLQVKQFQDSITFVISYKDGDGDLGENNPNVNNLFLTDNRNNITYLYRIQQLAPEGAKIAIEGKLDIVLNNTGIINSNSSQTVSYSIYVVDRAGNKSNVVNSPLITVIP